MVDDKQKNDRSVAGETYELAGLFARLMASILDGFLLVVIIVLLLIVATNLGGGDSAQLTQLIGLAVPVGYNWYFWTRRKGQTPGKFALGIRVIKADGTPISDTDAVIRAVGYQVSTVLCGLGYIWAIIDKNNQTWHDKLARTYVVRKNDQRHTVEI